MTKGDKAILSALAAGAPHATEHDPVAFRAALAERGWVVVPMEPTEAIIQDMCAAAGVGRTWGSSMAKAYRAMLMASK